MADIAQITVDNITYDIKDLTARNYINLTSDISISTGWTQVLTPSLLKQGKLCIFTFGIKAANDKTVSANSWQTVYTLPADAWPFIIFNQYVMDNIDYSNIGCRIQGNGTVQIYPIKNYAAGAAQIRGTIVYFTAN